MSWEVPIMRSRISCFNKTLFFKNITRFWPLWGAYLAIWCLVLPLPILSSRSYYGEYPIRAERYVLNTALYGGIAMTAVFAVLMAMAVWSFLYNARAAHGAACLPVRREGLFVSAALGGFVPLAAANVAVFLLAFAAEAAAGCLNLGVLGQWLGAVTLMLIFFYGFACFCAQLTGNIVVLPLLYGVLNVVVCGVTQLGRALLCLFLYGADSSMSFDLSGYFSPVVAMIARLGAGDIYVQDALTGELIVTGYAFSGFGLLAVYAAVGVVLGIAALCLMRRRRMESAGDVVAVQALKPIFRWCMALGCALGFTCLILVIVWGGREMRHQMTLFITVVLLLLGGAFIGWFAAEMLIRKSFRVFRRHWGGFGLCCLALVALMLCTELDVFGYERHIPAADEIEAVTITGSGEGVTLIEPESIELARAFHQGIIDHKPRQDQGSGTLFFNYNARNLTQCSLRYSLKNGGTVTRSYTLPYDPADASGSDAAAMQALLNCPEAIADRKQTNIEITEKTLIAGSVSAVMSAEECAAAEGYADGAEYILCTAYGFTPEEAAALSESERNRRVNGYVLDFAWNSGVFLSTLSDTGEPASYVVGDGVDVAPRDYMFNLANAYFYYSFEFPTKELLDLYRTAVEPDIADGTLGRVWILDSDESYDTGVYQANIDLSLRDILPDGKEVYETFSTTPTTDASRTAAWLAEHGVKLHTMGELR